MNERFQQAIILRNKGKTFRQIGKELGVSHGRASEIYYKALKLEKARKLPPQWTHGLRTKVANSLVESGYQSKAEVITALKNGEIRLLPNTGKSTIPGIGWQSLEELSIWAGLASPLQSAINDAIMLLKSHGYTFFREPDETPSGI